MDLDDLRAAFETLATPLAPSQAAWSAFGAAARPRRLRKGEHLLREGETAEALYFVRSGILRYYYLSDGVEHTGQFFDRGHFVSDVYAMTTGQPALQNIDAVVVSEVLVLPVVALSKAYLADAAFERWGRRLVEQAMAGSQSRTASLLRLSPEERYARFLAMRPEVARAVPQYTIASYLGITPEALSRIRRRRVGDRGG